jgi:hypothetical protein
VNASRAAAGLAVFMLATDLNTARAADAIDRVTRTIPLASGTPIHIDATIAELTVTGSDRQDLAVDIVRRAPSSADLAKFPAVVDQGAGGVRIGIVQSDDGKDPALKAEVVISAPATAIFQAIRVFEGRVKLTNLKTACDVDIRRGPIDASGLAGRVRLESGIGSIDLKQSELTTGGMMRLRIFNGPIRVRFTHPPTNGRILAVTFNGTLTSDIPLTMKDKFGPRFGETTLGTGDPVMSIDDVKGDISIKVG